MASFPAIINHLGISDATGAKELDSRDWHLLYLLDQNSRESFASLARSLRLSEQAVAYRIERLTSAGIIRAFLTFVNSPKVGYSHYKVYLKLENAKEETENRIFQLLTKTPNIVWVVSLSGKYDLSFSMLARTPEEFSRLYQEIEKTIGKYIAEKNVVIAVIASGFTRDFLVGKKTSRPRFYGSSGETTVLDDVEAKILRALSVHGRKSFADIAAETKLTTDIVRYRIKKLEEAGVINGYTVALDLDRIGYEHYIVLLYVRNRTPNLEERIKEFATQHPHVLFAVRAVGEHDYYLELEVRNHAELAANLKDFRRVFARHLRNFEVLRVVKEYKFDFFPLPEKNFG